MSQGAESAAELYVIDLDETTLNTGKVFNELTALYESEGLLAASVVMAARLETEASGGSFDTDGFYKQQGIPDDERAHIAQILGDNLAGKEYLYEDSPALFESLDETETPYLTVTWGAEGTQLPKLRATNLDVRPYLITDIKSKGDLIASWWDEAAGLYRVTATAGELLVAKSVLLLDDKAKSFSGLPDGHTEVYGGSIATKCGGYLVQRKPPKPSQMGAVPDGVPTVTNLWPIIDHILQTST